MKWRLDLNNTVALNGASGRRELIGGIGIGLVSLAMLSINSAFAQATGGETPPLMDRQKEIALALSACPPFAASKAAVYVLDKSGYVKVRDSQNGFTAIVQHSQLTSQEPRCMDAEGTRTHLPRILKVAELREPLEGRSNASYGRLRSSVTWRSVLLGERLRA